MGMREKKPRWFHLMDLKKNEKLDGRVYVAAEFIDANKRRKDIFKIDHRTNPFFLHLLTIGVRSLRSALGVWKPQVVYSAPLGNGVEEKETDPSSQPSAKNANFLIVQKLLVKIPIDYELAPVINIVVRDNLFGGLLKRVIGSASLDPHEFMRKTPDSKKNEWAIAERRIEILNEKELKQEMEAETVAERRTYKAAIRTNGLAIRKAVELAEARCQNRPFKRKELQGIEEMENRPIQIETEEEYDARVFAEEAEAARLAEEEEKEKEEAAQRKKEAEEKKKALQEKE